MTAYARIIIQAAALTVAVALRTPADEVDSKVVVAAEEGVPGGAVVAAKEITVTVEAIAPETRKITLVRPDGKKSVYQAGPAIANFDQIEVGDQVKVAEINALAVAVRKGDAPLEDTAATGVALAPLGDKPGVLVGDVVVIHATVKALDMEKRTGTLEFADGATKTVSIRPDVDMASIAVGDQVTIGLVEMLSIRVVEP